MLMPTISLAVGQIAVYMRLLRSDMIATLQEDFITTAKAKGIPTRRVLFRHALRPSSLTLLTVAGLNVGALIGGAIVVERDLRPPGHGRRARRGDPRASSTSRCRRSSRSSRSATCSLNFFVDILYAVLDPRIRHARAIA